MDLNRLGTKNAARSDREARRSSRRIWLACLAAHLGSLAALMGDAQAAQTNVSVAPAPTPAAPQALTVTRFAARAGSPLLYSLAVAGLRPLTFSATSLPAGVALANDTGTLTGTTPVAGEYPISVKISNALGMITQTFTLVSAETLAQTPPMGWNSYDSFGGGVNEAEVMAAARAQKAQLQPYGWNYVVVDYLWFDTEQQIDKNGRFLPSKARFPSATGELGFKPLADQVHALGLNFGIHIMRGIPRKAVSANSPIAGSSYTASQAGNTQDACPWDAHMWGVRGDTAAGQAWYDSLFAQYAAWGIDFVKVDDLLNNQVAPNVYHQAEVTAIRNAIDKTGRSIVLSLSPGPMRTADATHLNANANMWRMVNDFWDTKGLSTLSEVFDASGAWQATSGLSVGHWPDADMLPLGYIGPRCPVHTSGGTALTHNEQVSVMSLWGVLPSPLMFGGNEERLTTDATGPFTLSLLANEEVIAVNQDPAGKKGKRIASAGAQQTWVKDLSAGRKAVAFFNRSDADVAMSATLTAIGATGPVTARDLWKRADLAPVTDTLSMNVGWRGAALVLLTPALDAAAGGAGAGGSAGLAGAGGTHGGAGGTTSSAGGGGASGTPGGAGLAGLGGVPGSGGVAGSNSAGAAAVAGSLGGLAGATTTAGAASVAGSSSVGDGEAPPASDAGCSCGVTGAARPRNLALVASVLSAFALIGRRRRRAPTVR